MKRDKEWATGEVDRYLSYEGVNEARNALVFAKGLINQLEEPEVLSQELPVIPQWVADNIEDKKRVGVLLSVAIAGFPEFKLQKELNIDEHECNEIYARAWLDGYTVEEKEQKYYVMNNDNGIMLVRMMDGKTITEPQTFFKFEDMCEEEKISHRFSEQEIKDYDPRYWVFRKPIEEVE